jgi:hypothetical protein
LICRDLYCRPLPGLAELRSPELADVSIAPTCEDPSPTDVQLLAGQRSAETTERYTDGDAREQRPLIGLL